MRVLGVETSCDETACAVVEDGRHLLGSVVASQVKLHERFGGVVPEIASRRHLEMLLPVLDQALAEAGVRLGDIGAVAVTPGPGLVGALLVGLAAAKALAWALDVPLVPVHHLEAHVYAAFLEYPHLEPPLLALVVSGGHTDFLWMPRHGRMELKGRSLDDAAGEAFDKVGRLLGLPYPGGPHVEALAREGQPAIPFPRAWMEGTLDFSFSGLKTAVAVYLRRHEGQYRPQDVAASFQAAVVEVLAEKAACACSSLGATRLVVAGGVAANRALREAIEERCRALGVEVFIPRPAFCTDNAAMVASAGYYALREGRRAGMDLNASPALPLEVFGLAAGG
ncbi:MAG: tRNA (adenosine(37)-N6)-threonylcarbamoyltransferase complex transferase subunit TsaD [Bacillota bacterium]